TLSAKESNAGIDLYVKDTGVGISKDKTETIFLLQDGKSTQGTGGEKGTGLGLHLVQELVHLNQGTIRVASKLEEGTIFTIQLPKAA
ncbi:MAG: sensor histidine kinase, partial [Saprospiraceae bacterium]